jgi:hypothetical protein
MQEMGGKRLTIFCPTFAAVREIPGLKCLYTSRRRCPPAPDQSKGRFQASNRKWRTENSKRYSIEVGSAMGKQIGELAEAKSLRRE